MSLLKAIELKTTLGEMGFNRHWRTFYAFMETVMCHSEQGPGSSFAFFAYFDELRVKKCSVTINQK